MRNLTNEQADILIQQLIDEGTLFEMNNGDLYDLDGNYFEPLDHNILSLFQEHELEELFTPLKNA